MNERITLNDDCGNEGDVWDIKKMDQRKPLRINSKTCLSVIGHINCSNEIIYLNKL